MTDLITKARDQRSTALKERAVLERNIFADAKTPRRASSSEKEEKVRLLPLAA